MKIAIIGGGAAGFFSAISAKENYPDSEVTIFEKSQQLLTKVKISGGGRCNLTNGCSTVDELCSAYPRGGRQLKRSFMVFSNHNTFEWFESRGVPLVIQEDNCVFPASQNSQSIIDCFLREVNRMGVTIRRGFGVKALREIPDETGKPSGKLEISFTDEKTPPQIFDKIVAATGGSPQRKGLEWLEKCGHKIEDPVPSLYSFNIPSEPVRNLMGVQVENAIVSLQGTKLKASGPILITHWGMSGPAILKLSSYGARFLSGCKYNFNIGVNWVNKPDNDTVTKELNNIANLNSGKLLSSLKPYSLPVRLWMHLLDKSEVSAEKRWAELGKKGINRIMNSLTNDVYSVNGKATYREEYVTCGGVSLKSIDMNTMQSKVCKNLYFAGEVMDIDAITGGYNLQAAWTTGFIAGKLL